MSLASGWSPTGRVVSTGTAGAHAAMAAAVTSALRTTDETIPFWISSFDSGAMTYPYSMVGTAPSQPHTTQVRTVLIPIDLTFADAAPGVDAHVRGSDRVAAILGSPVFQAATYPATGDTTQFVDAVSCAEWAGAMKNVNHYHVLLDPPTVTPAVEVAVPTVWARCSTRATESRERPSMANGGNS